MGSDGRIRLAVGDCHVLIVNDGSVAGVWFLHLIATATLTISTAAAAAQVNVDLRLRGSGDRAF